MPKDSDYEGKKEMAVDIDRMQNEGLAGGKVTDQSGFIGHTVEFEKESPPRVNPFSEKEK